MRILEGIAAAFSMFSAIPVPQGRGRELDMRYLLPAFPLVGTVIGALSGIAAYLCFLWRLPDVLRGLVLTLIPVIITGGIHLDGYADTCDALASLKDTDGRHGILKDPHIGTFAVIRLCMYFATVFTLWCVLPEYPYINIILMYALSRVLSGLSVVSFSLYGGAGLAHMLAASADKNKIRAVLIFFDLILLAFFVSQGYPGAVMAAAAHIVFAVYHHICKKSFGGLSGDLCGWFLCKCELWMLVSLTALQLFEEVLK